MITSKPTSQHAESQGVASEQLSLFTLWQASPEYTHKYQWVGSTYTEKHTDM